MRKVFQALSIVGAMLIGALPTQAAVITFDQGLNTSFAPSVPFLTHGDVLHQGDYFVSTVSTKAGAAPGDLVGALVDSSDVSNVCLGLVCPTNNSSRFMAALNDGLPWLGRLDGGVFQLNSFDASFIAAEGDVVPPISLVLRVYGFTALAGAFFEDFLLPGPVNGGYSFQTFQTHGSLAGLDVVEVDFYGYACNSTGSCSRANNKAQFALDNINLINNNQVPEPGSLALVGVAFAALTGRRLRRAVKA